MISLRSNDNSLSINGAPLNTNPVKEIIMEAVVDNSKKRFVYKRDKGRHHSLMARESNPYRTPVSLTKRVNKDEKPPKRVEYNPDRSGLGKVAGTVTRRVGDQYAGVHAQQHKLRQARLAEISVDTVTDIEMDEWLRKNGLKR